MGDLTFTKTLLSKFAIFIGFNASDTQINQFIHNLSSIYSTMATNTLACEDIYINICEYLDPDSIIRLTISHTNFYQHYKYIWGYIQKNYMPPSLIPILDYKDIIQQISLDKYYITQCSCFDEHIYDIHNIEKKMQVMERSEHFTINTKSNETAFVWLKIQRDIILNKLSEVVHTTLMRWRFNSCSDCQHDKYYTIKPDIDIRFYGFNPLVAEDRAKGEIQFKWLTREYNTTDVEIVDEAEWDEQPPNIPYKYAINLLTGEIGRMKLKPDWVV